MEDVTLRKTAEIADTSGTKSDIPHTQQPRMATDIPSEDESKVTSVTTPSIIDGGTTEPHQQINNDDFKSETVEQQQTTQACSNDVKNKRKRRRGKPKANTKPYKKCNWKFQMPRYRNGGNGVRNKLARSRSIVPYNTNKFLMEEHMAEVPSALLTPSARTRDSSFSVDSEDNYFFSLPEDEEEFLTKEFANVYERARVERLESMSKQQLIEECLQLEDRYAQSSEIRQNSAIDVINKVRVLEEKIRELNAENFELRRKLDQAQGNIPLKPERMCSSTSEDSESDSSSTSSSSRNSTEYSGASSRRSSISNEPVNDTRMDSDDIESDQIGLDNNASNPTEFLCNGNMSNSSPSESKESSPVSSILQVSPTAQRVSLG